MIIDRPPYEFKLFFLYLSKVANYLFFLYQKIILLVLLKLFIARRKIVEVILLNFRSNLGHKDKLEVI